MKYTKDTRDFYFTNVKEFQPVFTKIENLAQQTDGVTIKKDDNFFQVNYTNAPPEVKKVLDETVERINEKIIENITYHASLYYFTLLHKPSELTILNATIVLHATHFGFHIPRILIIDALERFPILKDYYPEIVKEYEKNFK